MGAPVQLAAIDAGSNAIRLVIARATSLHEIQILENERVPVRLGHNAFTRRALNDATISSAARAFSHFRDRMDRNHVTTYRAVATSAAREARNARRLTERIRRKSGLELDVISSEEEARLVCSAVHWVLGDKLQPRLIFDLGGGSLELNFFQRGVLEQRIALPLGTIRMMETYSIRGVIDEAQAKRLQNHILSLLRSALPTPPNLSRAPAVACGGNAEALVRFASGPLEDTIPTINLRLLHEQMRRLVALDIPGRMRVFRVKEDRAEVLAIAAIIISVLAKWLNLRSMMVPGVGVREGVLLDLVADQYSSGAMSEEEKGRAEVLLSGVRSFARRLEYNAQHAEQVVRLAVSLFDQLRPIHEMGQEQRLILEMGALLHDVGHFLNRKAHNRHGEYLVRNGEIPELRGWRRDMVSALVRYHNTKSEPQIGHASYTALDGEHRRQVRLLTSFLRIAEKLESEHSQCVIGVDVQIAGSKAIFSIRAVDGTRLDLAGVGRKAQLFEKEFHLKTEFRRAQREKVA